MTISAKPHSNYTNITPQFQLNSTKPKTHLRQSESFKYLKKKPTKVSARSIYLLSCKFVLHLPHFLLLLHILHETHPKLKHLIQKKTQKYMYKQINNQCNPQRDKSDKRVVLHRKGPCSQCRYQPLAPRTGRSGEKA